jgi:hypothetical protein
MNTFTRARVHAVLYRVARLKLTYRKAAYMAEIRGVSDFSFATVADLSLREMRLPLIGRNLHPRPP